MPFRTPGCACTVLATAASKTWADGSRRPWPGSVWTCCAPEGRGRPKRRGSPAPTKPRSRAMEPWRRARPRIRSRKRCSPTPWAWRCWWFSNPWSRPSASPSYCTMCSESPSRTLPPSSGARPRRPVSLRAARAAGCEVIRTCRARRSPASGKWSARSSPRLRTAISTGCCRFSTRRSCFGRISPRGSPARGTRCGVPRRWRSSSQDGRRPRGWRWSMARSAWWWHRAAACCSCWFLPWRTGGSSRSMSWPAPIDSASFTWESCRSRTEHPVEADSPRHPLARADRGDGVGEYPEERDGRIVRIQHAVQEIHRALAAQVIEHAEERHRPDRGHHRHRDRRVLHHQDRHQPETGIRRRVAEVGDRAVEQCHEPRGPGPLPYDAAEAELLADIGAIPTQQHLAELHIRDRHQGVHHRGALVDRVITAVEEIIGHGAVLAEGAAGAEEL